VRFDDVAPRDRAAMRRAESRVLSKLGIASAKSHVRTRHAARKKKRTRVECASRGAARTRKCDDSGRKTRNSRLRVRADPSARCAHSVRTLLIASLTCVSKTHRGRRRPIPWAVYLASSPRLRTPQQSSAAVAPAPSPPRSRAASSRRRKHADKSELDRLWRAYRRRGGNPERNALVECYQQLVRDIARRFASRLPRSVDPGDLSTAANVGLMAAIESFDASRSVPFESYCELRVKGALIDELRTQTGCRARGATAPSVTSVRSSACAPRPAASRPKRTSPPRWA
jgi:hypothetical protein